MYVLSYRPVCLLRLVRRMGLFRLLYLLLDFPLLLLGRIFLRLPAASRQVGDRGEGGRADE